MTFHDLINFLNISEFEIGKFVLVVVLADVTNTLKETKTNQWIYIYVCTAIQV